MPKNVSGLVLKAEPGQNQCKADNYVFLVDGKKTQHGIITYYAAQALKSSDTMEEWVRNTMTLVEKDVAAERLPKSKAMPLAALGDSKQKLFAGPPP